MRHLRTGLEEIRVLSEETTVTVQADTRSVCDGLEVLSKTINFLSLSTRNDHRHSSLDSSSEAPKPTDALNHPIDSPPYVRFRTSTFKGNSCTVLCQCDCHQTSWLRSPRSLQGIIGFLFIGYSGLSRPSFFNRPCSEKMCHRHKSFSVSVNYYFPLWFLWRSIVIRNGNDTSGPSITLRTPRLVENDADVLFYALEGNINGMQMLFTKGEASPFDINCVTGESLMHVSIFVPLKSIYSSSSY